MINVLFASTSPAFPAYDAPLRAAFDAADLKVNLATEILPEDVDYVVYGPSKGQLDFTPFKRLKAVLSLWAGVETMVANATLTAPLCRMVDHGLTEGMVEWVLGHSLRFHLGMDQHLQDGVWRPDTAPPLARERKVCVLGLGALGAACAQALSALNFEVHGWARSAKSIEGVICHHGASGLEPALHGADIVVLLLPDTPATTHVLNAQTLAHLAPGAAVLNPGRGPLIDDDALLAALAAENGLGHATLDVFDIEPLPADHAYWGHPKVTVTPHIASETRAVTAAQVVAENIRRGEAGEDLLHVVDRDAGY